MTITDKNIIESYSGLFEGLSAVNKLELIERLSKSLKLESKSKEKKFYKSFGSFGSEKPDEDIIFDIKSNRKFIDEKTVFYN